MRTLVVAWVLPALLGASAAPAGRGPSLALVRKAPLTVHGSGFGARARVRVTETAPAPFVVVVRTTSAGTFTAGLVSGDPCSAVVVHAAGLRGGRAALRIPPGRLCAPARPTP